MFCVRHYSRDLLRRNDSIRMKTEEESGQGQGKHTVLILHLVREYMCVYYT